MQSGGFFSRLKLQAIKNLILGIKTKYTVRIGTPVRIFQMCVFRSLSFPTLVLDKHHNRCCTFTRVDRSDYIRLRLRRRTSAARRAIRRRYTCHSIPSSVNRATRRSPFAFFPAAQQRSNRNLIEQLICRHRYIIFFVLVRQRRYIYTLLLYQQAFSSPLRSYCPSFFEWTELRRLLAANSLKF